MSSLALGTEIAQGSRPMTDRPAATAASLAVAGAAASGASGLADVRRGFARLLAIILWANVPVVGGIAFAAGQPVVVTAALAVLALVFAGAGQFAAPRAASAPARLVMSAGAIAMAALAIAAAAGTPYQADLHLYSIAMLAILVGFVDGKALILGAVLIAGQHAALLANHPAFLMPADAAAAGYGRLAVHALIAFAVAGVLTAVCRAFAGRLTACAEAERLTVARADAAAAAQVLRTPTPNEPDSRMAASISAFRAGAAAASSDVATEATRLKGVAEMLTTAARKRKERLGEVDKAARDVLLVMDTANSHCETLYATASEIRRRTGSTAESASKVSSQANHSAEVVTRLADTVSQLHEMVATIQDVAEKTNLLALNATIEAARAGESGRGFAVVASEVKELAGQTAGATDTITQRIASIRSETDTAVAEIKRISELAETVRSDARAIEQGIDEQSEATQALTVSFNAARDGANNCTEGVGKLTASMGDITSASDTVQAAARGISDVFEKLGDTISAFLDGLSTRRN